MSLTHAGGPAARFEHGPSTFEPAPTGAISPLGTRRAGAETETVDVGEVVRAVGRGWRTVVAGGLLGLLVALGLVLFFPPRYRAVATVLLRNGSDATGSLLSRFGITGDAIGAGGGALGSVLKSPLETELQLLNSRDVLGQVVDSLQLQARVRAPHGLPARALFAQLAIPGSFKHVTVDFARGSDGAYRVDAPRGAATIRPGVPGDVPGIGRVEIRPRMSDGLAPPPTFSIDFEDREDAITRVEDHLSVSKRGGELVEVVYSGPDSVTAAEVPNAINAVYLQRRRTVDRGLNQRRYEFLALQADSVAGQLGNAENTLRAQQEASGVFDPELTGKAGTDALRGLDEQLAPIEAEQRAFNSTLRDADARGIRSRQIAAAPAFLKSPAVNSIITQAATLETERTRLLERRTERDPEVVALTQSIADLDAQLPALARTYGASLDLQVAELRRQRDLIAARLAELPRQAVGSLRGQRDVKRLSQTELALQAQLIDVRLAAMAEGGQVRAVDIALPPKKIYFPRPAPTFAAALVIGLLLGAAWAIVGGAFSTRVWTPDDAERASGVPAIAAAAGRPLLLGGPVSGSVLVLPVGAHADAVAAAATVADQLTDAAVQRGRRAAVLRVAEIGSGRTVASVVDELGREHDVVVLLGGAFSDGATAAALDARWPAVLVGVPGRLRRSELSDSAAVLARLGVPVIGVVLREAPPASAMPHGRDVARSIPPHGREPRAEAPRPTDAVLPAMLGSDPRTGPRPA